MAIREERVNELVGRFVTDLGAAFHAALAVLGERLGLYKAMKDAGRLTASELAERTGTHERYVREWLNSQAAGGYVQYDREAGKYWLDEEQAFVLADETSPAYLPGGFLVAVSALRAVPRIAESFRTGEGCGWHEHDEGLFRGTEMFFRPNYAANLVSTWIPALDGVEEKLRRGAKVADVGCGLGASTILMAQAYPESNFVGHDYHPASIDAARARAEQAGVSNRVRFEVHKSTEYPGRGFDFVTFFDCLHDMGDPAAAAGHVRRSLADDGTFMIVEPFAGDSVEENLTPVGRMFYGASTLICTPASLAQDGRAALGAQAGEARLREVVQSGGFTRFRRAAETPFNLIFEARP